ncbi:MULTISPECIES: MFS transporter [unclassified Streptomyces]|uniref:MFS transporter n=1 Tax=unclassified Streptomyces TaxID=2593676 RepID=UPI0022583131|nr:MFS transporter [Streptomyces sp. NBC_00047]MCX5609892.1 MFS transporter [Streptomyces sp. NBC_00047]
MAAVAPVPVRPPSARHALVAGSVGNFVEWYEFGVYGSFATVIAARFFTPDGGDRAEALIATYAAFAIAFFFRPLGALIFGRLADRAGRRPALVLAVALMTGATTLIGVLPAYSTAGAVAPWLLTLLRSVQGLSAGGEFGGAVSLLTETAPPGRRGRHGAWQSFTVALGLLTGAGVAVGLATLLSESDLYAWGWRIPFLLALPLGAVALWLRLRLPETAGPPGRADVPGRADLTGRADAPGRADTARAVVLGVGRIMGWSAAGYTFLVVLPSYLQATLGTTFQQALAATFVANLGFAVAILPAGTLSDRVGRRTVMLTGSILVVLTAVPLLHLLRDPGTSVAAKAALLAAAGAMIGLLAGPGPALLAEMFPTRVRSTGLGLAYALSNAVFSGCAGLIVTTLVRHTGNPDIPALYAAGACALAVPALLTLRPDDHLRPLR